MAGKTHISKEELRVSRSLAFDRIEKDALRIRSHLEAQGLELKKPRVPLAAQRQQFMDFGGYHIYGFRGRFVKDEYIEGKAKVRILWKMVEGRQERWGVLAGPGFGRVVAVLEHQYADEAHRRGDFPQVMVKEGKSCLHKVQLDRLVEEVAARLDYLSGLDDLLEKIKAYERKAEALRVKLNDYIKRQQPNLQVRAYRHIVLVEKDEGFPKDTRVVLKFTVTEEHAYRLLRLAEKMDEPEEPPCICPSYPFGPEGDEDISPVCPVHGNKAT